MVQVDILNKAFIWLNVQAWWPYRYNKNIIVKHVFCLFVCFLYGSPQWNILCLLDPLTILCSDSFLILCIWVIIPKPSSKLSFTFRQFFISHKSPITRLHLSTFSALFLISLYTSCCSGSSLVPPLLLASFNLSFPFKHVQVLLIFTLFLFFPGSLFSLFVCAHPLKIIKALDTLVYHNHCPLFSLQISVWQLHNPRRLLPDPIPPPVHHCKQEGTISVAQPPPPTHLWPPTAHLTTVSLFNIHAGIY